MSEKGLLVGRRASFDSRSPKDIYQSRSSSFTRNSNDPILRRLDSSGDLWRTREGNVIYWHGYKLHYEELMTGVWNWSASGGEHARKKLVADINHEKKPKHEKRVGLSDFVSPYRHKLLDEYIQRTYGDLYLIATSWKEVMTFLERPKVEKSTSRYHQKLSELETKLRFYLMISLREYDGLPLDPSKPGRASWPLTDSSDEEEKPTGWDIIKSKVPFSKSSSSSETSQLLEPRSRQHSKASASNSSSSDSKRGRRKSAQLCEKTHGANGVERTRSKSVNPEGRNSHQGTSGSGRSTSSNEIPALPKRKKRSDNHSHHPGTEIDGKKMSRSSSGDLSVKGKKIAALPQVALTPSNCGSDRSHRRAVEDICREKKTLSDQGSVRNGTQHSSEVASADGDNTAEVQPRVLSRRRKSKSQQSHRRKSDAHSQDKQITSNDLQGKDDYKQSRRGSTKVVQHDKKVTSSRLDDKKNKSDDCVSLKAGSCTSRNRESVAMQKPSACKEKGPGN